MLDKLSIFFWKIRFVIQQPKNDCLSKDDLELNDLIDDEEIAEKLSDEEMYFKYGRK